MGLSIDHLPLVGVKADVSWGQGFCVHHEYDSRSPSILSTGSFILSEQVGCQTVVASRNLSWLMKRASSWEDEAGNYGAIITAAREAAGMNISELARAMGLYGKEGQLDSSTMSMIERNKKRITERIYNKLVRALPNIDRLALLNAMGYRIELPNLGTVNLTTLTQLSELRGPYREMAERAISAAHQVQAESTAPGIASPRP